MSGNVFNGLTKLTDVNLRENECIDQNFVTSNRVEKLEQVVTNSCGYCKDSPFVYESFEEILKMQKSLTVIVEGLQEQVKHLSQQLKKKDDETQRTGAK